MKIALWIVQILLAFAFGAAGAFKAFTPHAQLAEAMPWVLDAPVWLPTFIGVAEIAGALGLILPAATRIKPQLTPLAAIGLVIVMVLAMGFHLSRGEFAMVPPNVVLALLAGFVAYGRMTLAPVEPRGVEHTTRASAAA